MAGHQVENHEFAIDLRGLIRLLAKHLYTTEDVFIRELLQNAQDSLEKRRVEQGNEAPPGLIRIRVDPMDRTITFTDNGCGLTESEIHEYLATIGRSGTDEFRQRLIQMGRQAEASLIGMFGIGLLSTFVVAKRAEVFTRSFEPGQPAWQWTSYGDKTYSLQMTDEELDVGTMVRLTLEDSKHNDFLQLDHLQDIVRKYADFLPFPIYLNDEHVPTNVIIPPWKRSYGGEAERDRAYFDYLNRRFPQYILHVIPVRLTTPCRIDGLLFVSDQVAIDPSVRGTVDIYQNGMFVEASNRELLPPWASFVGGVLDSPNLTLTLARDHVQQDAIFFEAQKAIGRTIVEGLKHLAHTDPEKLGRLLRWHHIRIKMMALAEKEFFDDIANLVPFDTNRGPMDLPTYFDYTVSPEDPDSRSLYYFTESHSGTLYYMLSDERGKVVINASRVFDEEFIEEYARRHPSVKLHLVSMPESETFFTPLEGEEWQRFRRIEVEFKRILPDPRSGVRVVRFKPEHMPAILMHSTDAKLYREVQSATEDVRLPESVRNLIKRVGEQQTTVPFTLYINAINPTISRLLEVDLHSDAAQRALTSIYNNALLLASPTLNRRQIETITRQANQVVDLLIAQVSQLEQARAQMRNLEAKSTASERSIHRVDMSKHVTCFIAMPFPKEGSQEYEVVLEALREVLEDNPYFWQVVRADESQLDPTIYGNVYKHIARAHCYIAEVSEHNFNVGLELGLMQQFHPRPIVLVRRKDASPIPADIKGAIYVPYPPLSEVRKVDLVELFRRELGRIEALKTVKGDESYLSPTVLSKSDIGMGVQLANELSKEFVTAESFIKVDPQVVGQKLRRPPAFISGLQTSVREEYGLTQVQSDT